MVNEKMNPIDGDRFFAFLTEQKVKETGAFSKGLNKGLNIARSALKNKEITLPWEVDRVKHGRWIVKKNYHHGHYIDTECFCSECNTVGSPQWKGCPVCLARMDGE